MDIARSQKCYQVFGCFTDGFIVTKWVKAGKGIQIRIGVAQSRQDGRIPFIPGQPIHQRHEGINRTFADWQPGIDEQKPASGRMGILILE